MDLNYPSRECNEAENVIKIDLSNFDYETIIDSEKIYKQIGILKNRNLSCDDPFHLNDVVQFIINQKIKFFQVNTLILFYLILPKHDCHS